MKKKLIFHFYIPDDWDTHPIVKLHFKLLRRYVNFFDEVKFVLAIDNTEDIDTILKIENGLIDFGFHNVEFMIIKNNPLFRESITFHDDFVLGIKHYDGVLYFGHSKGIFDISGYGNDYSPISHWVCIMYYQAFSDSYFYEISSNSPYLIIGSNKCIINTNGRQFSFYAKYGYCYGGTFFGINCPKLVEWSKKNDVNIETPLSGMYCSEQYPGYVIPIELAYGRSVIYPALNNIYLDDKIAIKLNFTKTEQEEYLRFYDSIEKETDIPFLRI